jgi:two-component system, chemotaxis family, sensor kinase Cph1
VRAMASEPIFQHGLTRPDADLLAFLDAGGAALAIDGELMLLGRTPTADQVRTLLAWLDDHAEGHDDIFATDQLSVLWPNAAEFQDTSAGVLAARLVRHRTDYVMWFRPEMLQTVHWAGDPNKPVEISEKNGEVRLSPRGSFKLYRESVQGRAKPWHEIEVKGAGDLRRAIVEVILRQAGSLERTNYELAQSNLELDSFAYVASHDLKEPLRGIHNYASLLARSHGDSLGEEGRSRLQTVLRLTQRMDDLIESLLHYSRVGRVELAIVETDLDEVLDEVLTMLLPRLEATGTKMRRLQRLPHVRCDRVRIREVLVNLIGNALKYNNKPERWIEIGWEDSAAFGPVFHVSDNGIGVASADQERIFQIFKRLRGRLEYGGGSGVGLTIVRRMVERHGGRVWVESVLGEGTSFRFTLAPATDGIGVR